MFPVFYPGIFTVLFFSLKCLIHLEFIQVYDKVWIVLRLSQMVSQLSQHHFTELIYLFSTDSKGCHFHILPLHSCTCLPGSQTRHIHNWNSWSPPSLQWSPALGMATLLITQFSCWELGYSSPLPSPSPPPTSPHTFKITKFYAQLYGHGRSPNAILPFLDCTSVLTGPRIHPWPLQRVTHK